MDPINANKENILKIGICSIEELEERVKTFPAMNNTSIKKRFIISREVVRNSTGEVIIEKAEDIDLAKIKLLRRYYKANHLLKTFSPDEGIAIVSDMNAPEGIRISMDILNQVMNLGGGCYEAFIDKVTSFSDLLQLYNKGLFPKLIIIGYIKPERLNGEILNFEKVKKNDPFCRVLELTHSELKVKQFFPSQKQINIDMNDEKSWKKFIYKLIHEYTKSYLSEDLY